MRYRWENVDDMLTSNGDTDRADFIGSTEYADLWLTEKFGVLICQYEGSDEYVSYYPPCAIYDHAVGLPNDYDPARDIKSLPPEARAWWDGGTGSYDNHDPMSIAIYLAVFAPYLFSDDERAALLVGDLTQEGE